MSSNPSSLTEVAQKSPKVSKHVHVTSDQGKVDQNEVKLSRENGDDVTWHSYDNQKATVVFASPDRSPFLESHFYVPAGGTVSSGPVRSDALKKRYKYTVVGEGGVNDPIIIIDQ